MQQRTPHPQDPKLSEILAPAFSDAPVEEISDALYLLRCTTGKIPANWTRPNQSITIEPYQWEEIRTATVGLSAVAQLSQILTSVDATPSPWLTCGLSAAIVALAQSVDGSLDRISFKAEMADGKK